MSNRYEKPGPGQQLVDASGHVFILEGWHDIGVRIEGSAAGAMHDFFRSLWNEQLQRPVESFRLNNRLIVSHDRRWRSLIARPAISLPKTAMGQNTGLQYVQVLRTVPQINLNATARQRGRLLVPDTFKIKLGPRIFFGKRFSLGPTALQIPVGAFAAQQAGYRRPRLNFSPQGVFEFKLALRQAIANAEEYVFIADQAMYALEMYALEVMDWIRDRMLRKPNLKVILFFGADPADPPNNFLAEAINNHLLLGLPRDATGDPINVTFRQWDYNTVHCKVSLVDDAWCAIGSANCMRRSLYTDMELSTCILQEPVPLAQLPTTGAAEANPLAHGKVAPSFVQKFRRDLWAHYCGIPIDPADPRQTPQHRDQLAALLDLPKALGVWNRRWSRPGRRRRSVPGVQLRDDGAHYDTISALPLNPFPSDPRDPFSQNAYNRVDPDSRQSF